jgi:Helix-turn-helix domain
MSQIAASVLQRHPRRHAGTHEPGNPIQVEDGLAERTPSPLEVVPLPSLVGVPKAARMYDVSLRTFTRWADHGLVPPGIRVGGRRLFNVAELAEHIAAGCPRVR